MMSGGFKSDRLKANLRVVIGRLKLLQKKKTELAQKACAEVAEVLRAGKEDRARLRVEQVVREDLLVEGMEILELLCDLLLARFGLVTSMKELDQGLSESVSSIIWATPRLVGEIPELKVVSDQLCAKYSKEFGKLCRTNQMNTVNQKLLRKLTAETPPTLLVEQYLVEIAKNYKITYQHNYLEVEPGMEAIHLNESMGKHDGPGSGSQGGGHYCDLDAGPEVMPRCSQQHRPGFGPPPEANYPPPLPHQKPPNSGITGAVDGAAVFDTDTYQPFPFAGNQPPPLPKAPPAIKLPTSEECFRTYEEISDFPESSDWANRRLPDLPPRNPVDGDYDLPCDDVDLDELSRRFQDLKKK
uniref:IST1 homolog n=1 Tax=Myxine glutinosa TaxID=7769 RepID=UPI00358F0D98